MWLTVDLSQVLFKSQVVVIQMAGLFLQSSWLAYSNTVCTPQWLFILDCIHLCSGSYRGSVHMFNSGRLLVWHSRAQSDCAAMNCTNCTYNTCLFIFECRRLKNWSWSTLMMASFSRHALKPSTSQLFLWLQLRALYQGNTHTHTHTLTYTHHTLSK